jgi:hypothetical protein
MAFTAYNPLLITITHPAPAAITATLLRPLLVVDAVGNMTTEAAVATSLEISGPGGGITDDFSLGNNNANKMGRAGEISDANYAIAAGANVTSTLTGAGTACLSTIICLDNS